MSGYVVESPNAQRAADIGGRVRDVPRPNFVLYYHPAEWQLTAEGELTPSISHMSLAPGAGANEKGDFQVRAGELRNRGYVEIPHDVLGAALPDYVARYTNHRGKGVCRTIFQQPFNDGTGTTRWRADTKAIRAFVLYLRKRGVVARPQPQVIEGLLIAQQRVLDRQSNVRPADNAHSHRRHEAKMQAYEKAIAYLREELEESIEVYGQPEVAARSVVFDLLEQELAESAPEADEVVRAVQAAKKPRRPPKAGKASTELPPPAPPEGGFTVDPLDDEDLE